MDVTSLFCKMDDFCKSFEIGYHQQQVSEGKKQRNRSCNLSLSEIMLILVMFHSSSGYRNFKGYYEKYILGTCKTTFPDAVSYSRFIDLVPRAFLPLCGYLNTRQGKRTGIAFVDSTPLVVCDNRRIHSNKVFNGVAQRGKNSMGWFFGLKLHLITNELGELLAINITPGNTDDRVPVEDMAKGLSGNLFGDKGYISQKLIEKLLQQRLRLVTRVKKNMKKRLYTTIDNLMLRKRSIIEMINDQLKNISHIEHSRHRSPINAMINVISGIIAYTWQEKKPKIRIHPKDMQILHGMTPGQILIAI